MVSEGSRLNQRQHLRVVVEAAPRDADKITDANVDRHPHAVDGHGAARFVRDGISICRHAAVRADILRVKTLREAKEGRAANARLDPAGIDPACCCLTPHGFSLPPGLYSRSTPRDLSRAVSVSA